MWLSFKWEDEVGLDKYLYRALAYGVVEADAIQS